MRLYEFDDNAGYYSPEKDNYSVQKLHDTRSPKITLKHLNQLKKMRNAETLENLVRNDLLDIMYGTPPEEIGAGGMIGPGGF